MKGSRSIVMALVGMLPGSAWAQNFDIVLAASSKNPSYCAQADYNFVKKWSVVVSGDQAVVTGGNSLTLKKIGAGKYGTETVGGKVHLTWVVVSSASGTSFSVTSRMGCVWEGKAP